MGLEFRRERDRVRLGTGWECGKTLAIPFDLDCFCVAELKGQFFISRKTLVLIRGEDHLALLAVCGHQQPGFCIRMQFHEDWFGRGS